MYGKRSARLTTMVTSLLLLGLLLQITPPPIYSQTPDAPTYLLWLVPPEGIPPADMPPQLIPGFYLSQVHVEIARVSFRLETLAAEGQIIGFTPLPGANAVRVQVPSKMEDNLSVLERLPPVARVTPADAIQIAAARRALASAWKPLVTAQGEGKFTPQATNPSIFVSETYDDVYGTTDPGASVDIVLKDSGGGTKDAITTYADYETGYYYASFREWNPDTDVVPGDIVEVTADAIGTTSLTVDYVTGHVDRTRDQVTGTAPAERSKYISIHQYRNTCSAESDSVWVPSG